MSIIATQEQEQEEELFNEIAICDTSLSTPVVDRSAYINEIHCRLKDRQNSKKKRGTSS